MKQFLGLLLVFFLFASGCTEAPNEKIGSSADVPSQSQITYSDYNSDAFREKIAGLEDFFVYFPDSNLGADSTEPAYVEMHKVGLKLNLLKEDVTEFNLNLFDGLNYKVVKYMVEKRSENDFSWFGRISGAEMLTAIFTVKDAIAVATIPAIPTVNPYVYEIKPIKDGEYHVLIKVDTNMLVKGDY